MSKMPHAPFLVVFQGLYDLASSRLICRSIFEIAVIARLMRVIHRFCLPNNTLSSLRYLLSGIRLAFDSSPNTYCLVPTLCHHLPVLHVNAKFFEFRLACRQKLFQTGTLPCLGSRPCCPSTGSSPPFAQLVLFSHTTI